MAVNERSHYNLSLLGAKPQSESSGRVPARLLIIDGDAGDYPSVLTANLCNCLVQHTTSLREGYDLFLHTPVDMLLVEHSDSAPCFELLQLVKAARPRVPVVVLTACGSEADCPRGLPWLQIVVCSGSCAIWNAISWTGFVWSGLPPRRG